MPDMPEAIITPFLSVMSIRNPAFELLQIRLWAIRPGGEISP